MSIESITKFFQEAQNNETLMQKPRAISLDNEDGLNADELENVSGGLGLKGVVSLLGGAPDVLYLYD